MKIKVRFIIIIITASASGAFAQVGEPSMSGLSGDYAVSDYEPIEIQPVPMVMEVIHTIPVGSGDFEMGYLYEDVQGGMTTSPHDMLITKDRIYFYDEYNQRMVAFSRDFTEFEDLGVLFQSDYSNYLDGNDEYLISSGRVYNLTENKSLIDRDVLAYDNVHPEYGGLNPDGFSFVDNRYLILDDRFREGIIVLDLSLDNGTFDDVMYDEAAEEYLKENSDNIEVIDGRYILSDRMLMTKSVLSFFRYFKEHNSQINYNDEEMGYYLTDFSGIDTDGNYYWTAYDKQIFIFEIGGNFVQAIQAETELAGSLVMWTFCIDDEGNIYSLAIDDQRANYKLLRIKRDW